MSCKKRPEGVSIFLLAMMLSIIIVWRAGEGVLVCMKILINKHAIKPF